MKYEPIRPGYYYHIYNQGINKDDIFLEPRNYPYFLSLVDRFLLPTCEIFAYCLMTNHFHILLKTSESSSEKILSHAFSNLFNAYAKSINKATGRSGTFFKSPFKRKRLENEKYLMNLILYIHLNPTHHGLTINFRDYIHSSFRSYFSKKPSKLNREFVLNLFDGEANLEYMHGVRQPELGEELTFE